MRSTSLTDLIVTQRLGTGPHSRVFLATDRTHHRVVVIKVIPMNHLMAPEDVTDAPYDAKRADVWSLGMVLFILLTGSPLVETASPSDASFRALHDDGAIGILRVCRMDPELSEESIKLLERLLRIPSAERPPDARAILTDPLGTLEW